MELLSQTLTLNSSNTSENSDLVCSDWFRKREVIWYWVMSTLSILSLLGNGLLITIIFKNHKLRTTMNLFVVNVAISDMCFSSLFNLCNDYHVEQDTVAGWSIRSFYLQVYRFFSRDVSNWLFIQSGLHRY